MDKFTINIQTVNINLLVANGFNPKKAIADDKETAEQYQQVKKSVAVHGLLRAIIVRENEKDQLEIVDGFHRYTACKELGFENIKVNNLGKISLVEAQQRLLNFEKAFIPVDPIAETQIIKSLFEYTKMPIIELAKLIPFTEQTIKSKLEIIDFDFDSLAPTKQKVPDGKFIVKFHLSSTQERVLLNALAKAGQYSQEVSLVTICEHFKK